MKTLFLNSFFCFFLSVLFAQQELSFSSGKYPVEKSKNHFSKEIKQIKKEKFDNRFFFLVQFTSIPTQEEKDIYEKEGVSFLNYIPNNAYIVSLPSKFNIKNFSKQKNINTLYAVKPQWKLSKNLKEQKYPKHALIGSENISIVVSLYEKVSIEKAKLVLESKNICIEAKPLENSLNLEVVCPISNIEKIAKLPFVSAIEPISGEPQPENYNGRTLHRTNTLYHEYSGGLDKYNGNGVTVMLQDDGIIGPHIDYTGRVDNSAVTTNSGDHGDHVAGILMGAGNLNPRGRGNAWGANLLVYSAASSNYNLVPNLYNTKSMVITSKSYGDGCNDGYTSSSNQLDKQSRDYRSLLHFFSAGNSGTTNCGYGTLSTWGNITGGNKLGKNVLAIGNVDRYGVIASSSSRGPATDGRIKPDVCAEGSSVFSTTDSATNSTQYATYSGTSMACPGASGTMASLYQAYKELNGNTNPDGALMKAIMLNTADDYGNKGPDFIYGWGIINAKSALKVLKNGSYILDSITQGATKQITLNIPANTKKAKIMLYWHDKEAATNASPALVNNLDLKVQYNLVDYFPWKLSHTATNTALSTPAAKGVDSLNNMEQVEFYNPTAGSYTVVVSGTAIPMGPQRYYIVYDFTPDDIKLTYPIGAEGFVPGEVEVVRWDCADTITNFKLEYSSNNGASWTNINSSISGKQRSYAWTIPGSVLSGKCKLKITKGTIIDTNIVPFSIMNVPSGLTVVKNCSDSFQLNWTATSGATSYQVFKLGAKYMDSIATVNTNKYISVFSNNPTSIDYYAVKALGPNGAISRRCVAIKKNPVPLNCISTPPIAKFKPSSDSICMGTSLVFSDSTKNNAGATYSWSFGSGASPATATTSGNKTVSYTTTGIKYISLTVTNVLGTSIYRDTIFIKPIPAPTITGIASVCANSTQTYSVTATSGDIYSWTVTGGTIQSGQGTSSISVLWGTIAGSVSVTQTRNSCSVSKTLNISQQIPSVVSGNTNVCALSTIYYSVPTIVGASYNWIVTGGAIQSGQGTNTISVKWGTGTSGSVSATITTTSCSSNANTLVTIKQTPTPQIVGDSIFCINTNQVYSISNFSNGIVGWYVNNGGSVISGQGTQTIQTSWNNSDTSLIIATETLNGCIGSDSFSVIVQNTPDPSFTSNAQNGNTYQFVPMILNNVSYKWDFGNGSQSTSQTPNNSYSSNNSFSVCLTVTDTITKCFNTSCQNINTTGVGLNDFIAENIKIYPSPSTGLFYVKTPKNLPQTQLKMIDAKGSVVIQKTFKEEIAVDAKNLSRGVYMLILESEGKRAFEKIVLE